MAQKNEPFLIETQQQQLLNNAIVLEGFLAQMLRLILFK